MAADPSRRFGHAKAVLCVGLNSYIYESREGHFFLNRYELSGLLKLSCLYDY